MINTQYLETARKDGLLTISEASKIAGISPTTYNKILRGEAVTPRVLKKLMKALKLEKSKLIMPAK